MTVHCLLVLPLEGVQAPDRLGLCLCFQNGTILAFIFHNKKK
ncbi:hypothetical protein SD77_3249 [Bacillus badius]|uniref:Ribose 5-phosphate isomerase B n=1 Tax=Bacillus badius TaxID=1455 RepID=A0ABR5AYT1_BACBA|nr:hypothetical protein SD78_0155 [Bacillus badius]KIL79383.1 hypothetical protein SD77_3249 [Bacillus badius]